MVQNMNILNKKIRPLSLFYLCFVMYTISNALTLTNFRNNESLFIYPIYLYIRVICAIILAIIIISNKQIRIKLIFLFPLIIFLGLSTYFSESWNLALLVLFAIASDGVDVKKNSEDTDHNIWQYIGANIIECKTRYNPILSDKRRWWACP